MQIRFEVAWLGDRSAKLRHGKLPRRFDCITWIPMQSRIFEIFMHIYICPRAGTIYWCEPLLSKIWWFRFPFSHSFWIHQFTLTWFQSFLDIYIRVHIAPFLPWWRPNHIHNRVLNFARTDQSTIAIEIQLQLISIYVQGFLVKLPWCQNTLQAKKKRLRYTDIDR